jgi:SAM-dependent MidA family methyltransferase
VREDLDVNEARLERAGPVSVDVRRVPGLDLAAPLPESDPRLAARIAGEIRARGPMTFARFMELALYDPEAGYYTQSLEADAGEPRGPGREGDFLTAPEGHPIFGWAIGREVEAVWDRLGRPSPFFLREHGAGTGTLALAILDGLRRSGSALLAAIRYQPVERSRQRLDRLRARFDHANLGTYVLVGEPPPGPGVVIANEMLDALPVHRVEGAPAGGGRLLERYVELGEGDAFTTSLGSSSNPALEARLDGEGITLAAGQPAEICLAVDDWVAAVAPSIDPGLLLLIDYGADARDLYAATRGSTLRAYHRHRVHDDPLVAIGRQDLTAHVDLTAVTRAASAAGLEPLGRTTQAQLLANLGLGELLVALQSEPGTTLESYVQARSAVVRLLDPRATGGFAVLAFGRGLAASPPLRGFDPAAGAPGTGPGAPPDPNR